MNASPISWSATARKWAFSREMLVSSNTRSQTSRRMDSTSSLVPYIDMVSGVLVYLEHQDGYLEQRLQALLGGLLLEAFLLLRTQVSSLLRRLDLVED